MIYTIQTTEEKVLKGERLIKESGGHLYTDGTFEVSGVEGSYSFEEKTGVLTVHITDKPFLASWSMIKEKLEEFFE